MSAVADFPVSPVTVADIRDRVAAARRLSIVALSAERRDQNIVEARQITMYLAKRRTRESLPTIGSLLGDFNHTTVLHAHRVIEERRDKEPALDAEISAIERSLDEIAPPPSDLSDIMTFARKMAEDPTRRRPSAVEAKALAEAFLDERTACRINRNRANSLRVSLRRALVQRTKLDKAIGDFLDATDAIRTAPGEEARFLAREAQHKAFLALRETFETLPKEKPVD